MNKIAITGSQGNLGSRLVKLGAEPLLCDVTNRAEVERELFRVKPDVILHLAAQTSVDWCEEHYEEAVVTNVYGTNIVCEVAEYVLGYGKVALISTDQIFDGEKGRYKEDDEPNPINNYGLTKLSAEGVVRLYLGNKIVRISRCFDSKSKDINDYLNQIRSGIRAWVPDFIERSYCHLDLMALSLYRYAVQFNEMPEVLHIAGYDIRTFCELMVDISRSQGIGAHLVYPRNQELNGFVPRPHLAGLDVSLAVKLALPIYDIKTSVEKLKYENT